MEQILAIKKQTNAIIAKTISQLEYIKKFQDETRLIEGNLNEAIEGKQLIVDPHERWCKRLFSVENFGAIVCKSGFLYVYVPFDLNNKVKQIFGRSLKFNFDIKTWYIDMKYVHSEQIRIVSEMRSLDYKSVCSTCEFFFRRTPPTSIAIIH